MDRATERTAAIAAIAQASEPADAGGETNAADPYARAAQTFPHLDPEMTARVAAYGAGEDVPEGTLLFERGQRSVDFFLVLAGRIALFETEAHAAPTILTTHEARQFTGELDLFNDREILVSGRAEAGTRVIRVKRADFRRLVAGEPDIGEIIMRAFILRRVGLIQHGQGGVILIGSSHSADMLRMQRFLTRNGYPLRLLDTDADPDAEGFLDCFHLSADQLPVVITPEERVLRNPSTAALADAIGLTSAIDPARLHDVAVVGAGPAGLAAAVYAASEGLDVIVIEGIAPGGQAGTSSKIENYLGFPTGISGQALAGRAQVQAQKFGARLAISRHAVGIDCTVPYGVRLEDGQVATARAVIVASGARYRTLDVPDYARFEGQGIHYAATAIEATLCAGEQVAVIGGGNSAGQAAVFLSRFVDHVHILIRGAGLAETMSDYLVERIASSPKITLHPETEIVALAGETYLAEVRWRGPEGERTVAMGNIFVMIGAVPNTGWLDGCVDLDTRGFVVTGRDRAGCALDSPYVTSRPGIFAVGDVRAQSIKRVASSVGEGSVVVSAVHRWLATEDAR